MYLERDIRASYLSVWIFSLRGTPQGRLLGSEKVMHKHTAPVVQEANGQRIGMGSLEISSWVPTCFIYVGQTLGDPLIC